MSDTKWAVQPKKMVRDLKFRVKKVECTMYVVKTKGADQLGSYCAADLRLCFHRSKKQVFSHCGSDHNTQIVSCLGFVVLSNFQTWHGIEKY